MQLTVLIDNYSDKEQFEMEHGLSFYIDTSHSRILFDTGQSGAFIRNALKMGVDISDIEYLVLSHGHFDHTGGIEEFLYYNTHAKILLKPETLLPKYSGNRYIGVPNNLNLPVKRMIQLGNNYKIDPLTEIFGSIPVYYPEDTHYDHFFIKDNEKMIPDTFQDEIFISIKTGGSIAIITGCSHNGILNIIDAAQQHSKEPVKYLFGGFHLKDADPESIVRTADFLNTTGIEKIVTGHCTGMENYLTLKSRCKAHVSYSFTGNSYIL